jgi:hypothetical protein
MHTRLTLLKRSLVGGLVVAAASLPAAAQARPVPPDPPGWSGSPSPLAPSHAAGAQSSFEWSDAGIGAAGTLALLGTGALASRAVRRRGAQRPIVH